MEIIIQNIIIYITPLIQSFIKTNFTNTEENTR